MQASVEPLGLLVAAIRRSVKAMVVRRVKPIGLNPLQFWVLVGALEAPGASQADLSRRLRIDEPSVSRVVAGLAVRGWLRATRQDDDRRRIMLALTPSGRSLARRLAPIAAEIRAEVEAPLDPVELARARASLARVASHLQERCQAPARPSTSAAPRAARLRSEGVT